MLTDQWNDKSVLITGVCGDVGEAILRILEQAPVSRIVGADYNEAEVFYLKEAYRNAPNIGIFRADICDHWSMKTLMEDIDVIIHCAALKHIATSEDMPEGAIQTNIVALSRLIEAATQCAVARMVLTSSDKAVNPTNVMGTSKLMGERLMTAKTARRGGNGPILMSTRFGNVLGSRGSVVPVFHRQIAAGGPVTVTDSRMTRFVMSLDQAARLVLESVMAGKGGEVFVTKMETLRIVDLAEVMIEELAPRHGHRPEDVRIEFVGVKPGEKLYEELTNSEETRRTVDVGRFLVVLPALGPASQVVADWRANGRAAPVEREYRSDVEELMSKERIREFLRACELI